MAVRYVSLINFTDQGIKNAKNSPDRVKQFEEMFAKEGGRLEVYYTMGTYDAVGFVEGPDDETVARWLLGLGAAGNVRTTTFKAFSRDEFQAITRSL